MKKLISFNFILLVLIALISSCKKSENHQGSPIGKINSIHAYYDGFDTINLTDSSQFFLDTTGYLLVNFQFDCKDNIAQISGFSTGANASFTGSGFTETFSSSGEHIKTNGFTSNHSDNFNLKISANSLQQESITFQVFGSNRLYTDVNFQFNSVIDSTLYK